MPQASLAGGIKLPAKSAAVRGARGGAELAQKKFIANAHIGTSCTRVQFNAGPGNGAECPAASIYGHASATTPILSEPLEGNVYLRSNGGERNLPDLVAALHGQEINIDLVGFIESGKGGRVRNTFAAVPDAPAATFTLNMFGGNKGLLVNSTSLCTGTHRAIVDFTGQNGKLHEFEPLLKASACGKKGKKGKK